MAAIIGAYNIPTVEHHGPRFMEASKGSWSTAIRWSALVASDRGLSLVADLVGVRGDYLPLLDLQHKLLSRTAALRPPYDGVTGSIFFNKLGDAPRGLPSVLTATPYYAISNSKLERMGFIAIPGDDLIGGLVLDQQPHP